MPSRNALLPFSMLALAGLLAACGSDRREAEAQPQSPLVGSETVTGITALHDTVYARALRGDTVGMVRVLVNDSVYRARIWPTSASYDPDRESVWEFVISMHKANSTKGLRRLMGDVLEPSHGSPVFPVFEPTEIEGGTVYHAPKRELDRGGLRLFGSALCIEGTCQVISYNQGGVKGGPVDRDRAPGDSPESQAP